VSISRRGLLAAGLAVVAVGAMGIASTMNAGAAETPTSTADTAVVDPAVDPAVDSAEEPPALLPNGETPRPLKKGRFGASSEALAAAGASAAADDSEDSVAFGPKGKARRNGVLKTSETTVPPRPPTAKAAAATDEVNYLYAVGKQTAVTDGVSALFSIGTPRLGAEDWHSLAEIAVQSADEQQIVEVGWTVDRSTFGDSQAHLFVYHWVNGQETCYNCDFVPYSKASIKPGAVVTESTLEIPNKLFGIQRNNGAWWIAYDTEWIGSFPDKLWNGTFTQSGLVQVFGEVATSTPRPPCTSMGNGKTPSLAAVGDAVAARISSVTYLNGPVVKLKVGSTTDMYPTLQSSDRSFRYGGRGTADTGIEDVSNPCVPPVTPPVG